MRIIFVSYIHFPDCRVGSRRASFWHKHACTFGIESTLITTTAEARDIANVRVLPNPFVSFFTSIRVDPSIAWGVKLRGLFKTIDVKSYDFVVLTGSPFLYFNVGSYLHRMGVRVVLDFRDPFLGNPHHNDSVLKRLVKEWLERKWLKSSAAALVVNEACKTIMLQNHQAPPPIAVIENGFDSELITGPEKPPSPIGGGPCVILYAGSFIIPHRDPGVVVNALKGTNCKLNHLGRLPESLSCLQADPHFESMGVFSGEIVVRATRKADICLVLTGGHEFESTTKIYEYIGLNKLVLIVTNGEKQTGALNSLTRSYPNVFWSCNNEQEIRETITRMRRHQVESFDSFTFSRSRSYSMLVEFLSNLKSTLDN